MDLDKLLGVKTSVKVITIKRDEKTVKDKSKTKMVFSQRTFKSVSGVKEGQDIPGMYFTGRIQSFLDFFSNPILLLFFVVSALWSFFQGPKDFIHISLLVLSGSLVIVWLLARFVEKKMLSKLNASDSMEVSMKILNNEGAVNMFLLAIYVLIACAIIFFELGALFKFLEGLS